MLVLAAAVPTSFVDPAFAQNVTGGITNMTTGDNTTQDTNTTEMNQTGDITAAKKKSKSA